MPTDTQASPPPATTTPTTWTPDAIDAAKAEAQQTMDRLSVERTDAVGQFDRDIQAQRDRIGLLDELATLDPKAGPAIKARIARIEELLALL